MAGDRIFGSAMMGFDKNDVNSYLDKLSKEFETKIREKEEEINLLKLQNKDIRTRYEEAVKKNDNISENKNKIVEVLIKAQEKAEAIIEESKKKSEILIEETRSNISLERKAFEENLRIEIEKANTQILNERQKLAMIKDELLRLKKEALNITHRLESDLDKFIEIEMKHANELETQPVDYKSTGIEEINNPEIKSIRQYEELTDILGSDIMQYEIKKSENTTFRDTINETNAKENSLNESTTIENSINESNTIENSLNESNTTENSINESNTIENSLNESTTIENSINESNTTENSLN